MLLIDSTNSKYNEEVSLQICTSQHTILDFF